MTVKRSTKTEPESLLGRHITLMGTIISALDRAASTGVPLLIWGQPGIGKSALVESWAKSQGLPCETLILSISEPADIGGYPTADGDKAIRLLPDWFVRLEKAGKGLLFLDELTTAPPASQAAALRLLVSRSIHDRALPRTVVMVAAANPVEQATGGWDLAPAMASRFTHVSLEIEASEWVEKFVPYWGKPPELPGLNEQPWVKARAKVAAFISRNPSLLAPAKDVKANAPFPCPRSWDHLSRRMALGATDYHSDVGEGAARELLAWLKDMDLPDPELVLAGETKLPTRDDRLYATLLGVAGIVAANPTLQRWKAVWKLLGEVEQIDVAVTAARILGPLYVANREGLPAPDEARKFLPVLRELAS